jgi:hypothetical protein
MDHTKAFMWVTIVYANSDEKAAKAHDHVATNGMSPNATATAKVMAIECINSGYKNCGD